MTLRHLLTRESITGTLALILAFVSIPTLGLAACAALRWAL